MFARLFAKENVPHKTKDINIIIIFLKNLRKIGDVKTMSAKQLPPCYKLKLMHLLNTSRATG